MKKSCHNCQDYFVCYGFDDIEEDKGENCSNWHLDFMIYQDLIEQRRLTAEENPPVT